MLNRFSPLIIYCLFFTSLTLGHLSITGCGMNALGTFSDKDTDAAKLEDAEKLLDTSDFDAVISKILSMSSEGQGTLDAKKVLAGAYAGKCGLSFLGFLSGLTSPTATGSMFQKLMGAMSARTPDLSSCSQVEVIVKSIGTAAQRPSNVNFFFAIYGFAKIGLYLRNYADTNGDGATDGGFNSCAAGSITDDQIREIFTGFGIALENFTTVLSSIGSSQFGTDVLNLQGDCETVLGAGNCDITDTSQVDGTMVDAMRDILKTSAYGIEGCAATGVTIPTCC